MNENSNSGLILHHLPNSRSHRILWLLEELSLDYEVVTHHRDPLKPDPQDSLSRVHPLGKAPVLQDGERFLAETGAIVTYLLETRGQGRLIPAPGTEARRQYTYWSHFAEGSLMPYLVMKLVFAGMVRATPWPARPVPWLINRAVSSRYLDPNLLACLRYLDLRLRENPWLAGSEFTAADILNGFMLEAMHDRILPAADTPGVSDFLLRVRQRPAWQAARERGGWSDADHHRYWQCLNR